MYQLFGQSKIYMTESNTDVVQAFWIYAVCFLLVIILLQPEDLIKALMELENSASQDAVVREKIANLPAEVQDVSLLDKIEGI